MAALAAILALACFVIPRAQGAEALYLSWNDCPGGFGSTQSRVFGCGTNNGAENLIAAFSVAQPLDSVIGIEAVVDIQVAADSLPPWWQLGAGGCRDGLLSANENFTSDTTCADPWKDTGVAVVQDFQLHQPRGGTSQARIEAVVSIPAPNIARLDAGTTYYGVRLVISHEFSIACTGCQFPACIVLNSIWLRRVPGAPGGDLLLTVPGASDGNFARWQNGQQGDCQAVPVHRVTWGRLRSFYRP